MTYTDAELTVVGATYHRADGKARKLRQWSPGSDSAHWEAIAPRRRSPWRSLDEYTSPMFGSGWLRWCRAKGGIVRIEVSS